MILDVRDCPYVDVGDRIVHVVIIFGLTFRLRNLRKLDRIIDLLALFSSFLFCGVTKTAIFEFICR